MNDNRKLIDSLNEEHSIRPRYDRSRGQIDKIIQLCDEVSKKINTEISFSNQAGNHYILDIDGVTYDFNLYRDVIQALELLNRYL